MQCKRKFSRICKIVQAAFYGFGQVNFGFIVNDDSDVTVLLSEQFDIRYGFFIVFGIKKHQRNFFLLIFFFNCFSVFFPKRRRAYSQ